MGQISAAIAHELNQLLAAIMNYVRVAQRLLEMTGDTSQPRMNAREAMAKAANQTGRAGTIIQRLRDFVEKRERERASESLNKTVEESIALGFVGAAHTNVKVKLALDPANHLVVIARFKFSRFSST